MAFISANWAAIVAQHRVDPVNPAHITKKRKTEHTEAASSSASSASPSPKVNATSSHRALDRASARGQTPSPASLIRPSSSPSTAAPTPTLVLAMDCEMVGVGPGGVRHALARCSIVNAMGAVLLDRYVQPQEAVVDFRTAVSGIRPQHLERAHAFHDVQREVAALLPRRILVGHGLHTDLAVLLLSHPRASLRDTARWKRLCPDRPRALKVLAKEHLGVDIQTGEHDSVVDARAALALYLHFRKQWELDIAGRASKGRKSAAEGGTQPRPQRHRDEPSASPASAHPRHVSAASSASYTSEGRLDGAQLSTASPPSRIAADERKLIQREKRVRKVQSRMSASFEPPLSDDDDDQ